MAKKIKVKEVSPVEFGDFLLCNPEKVNRAINGFIGPGGKLVGGVGKDAPMEVVIAEYDKLAGLIRTKDGEKVKTGSFYDFENKKPRTEPIIELVKSLNATGGPVIKTEEVGDEETPKKKGRKAKIEEE